MTCHKNPLIHTQITVYSSWSRIQTHSEMTEATFQGLSNGIQSVVFGVEIPKCKF